LAEIACLAEDKVRSHIKLKGMKTPFVMKQGIRHHCLQNTSKTSEMQARRAQHAEARAAKSPWQILTNEQYFLRVADPSSRLRQEWCMRHVLQVAWRSGISVKVMRTPAGSAAVDKTSGWGRTILKFQEKSIFALEDRSAKSRFHHPYGPFLRGVLRDRTTAHETASPQK
jgi:hypothetical protein